MAVYNGIYKILNNEGTYDVVNLKTTAEQVVESSNKRFVTDAEKSTWNSKANASHTHTSAQIADATNANTANMIVKRDSLGNFSAGTITANLAGNATTATTATRANTLSTARTINGTSFNGSANIVTANWGTARNITIGSTTKSVNGSADISWSLSEIGAAAASHTHNYAAANHTHTSLNGINLDGVTASLNDYNLSSGSPKFEVYFCPTDGGGANITGRPNDSTKQAFNLIVESLRYASSTDYITKQTYVMGAQKIIYVRYCTNGTWSAWEKVYTSVQKPTASEIGAAASSHTHNYAGSSSAGGAATTALACTGNSATATKLATARTINGTNFDGTANITTAQWGTSRTITIGSTAKSVNGSANVSWSLSEIGAAAASHTHSYLPLSGGTITASSFGPLIIKRSGSTNGSSIAFVNDSGTLGYVGMSGNANEGLKRWSADTNTAYTVLDTGNYKSTITPANIGAAASSHTHNYAGSSSAGGAANSAVKLNTARTINGVSFDGTANITITAAPTAHNHSASDITGLGSAATKNTGTAAGNIPVLDSTGKLSSAILPSVAINNTHTVDTVAKALALSCDVGDIVIITSYVQPATLSEQKLQDQLLSKETQRALNSGSNTFICVNKTATTFDAKFKVLMSSSDSVTHAELTSQLATKANTSHNHDSTYLKLGGGSVTGNIVFNNNVGVQGKNTSGTAYAIARVTSGNQTYLGTESLPTVIASSSNPQAKVGSNTYTIYHSGNKPTASDIGALTQSTADSRYRQKTDRVFIDTISIITPAT